MDSQTLERLMLDRALGALSTDCEALLAAYMREQPAAANDLREIENTVRLARGALAQKAAGRMPAFPAERLRQEARRRWHWQIASGLTGIAASVLIGFGLHAAWFPTVSPSRPGAVPTIIAQGRIEPDAEPGGRGFWSAQRLQEQRAGMQPSHLPTNRLIWHSPAEFPEIGGAT